MSLRRFPKILDFPFRTVSFGQLKSVLFPYLSPDSAKSKDSKNSCRINEAIITGNFNASLFQNRVLRISKSSLEEDCFTAGSPAFPAGALRSVLRILFSQGNATVPFPADDNRSVPAMLASPERDPRGCGHWGRLKGPWAAWGAASPEKGLLPGSYSPRLGGRAQGRRQHRGAGPPLAPGPELGPGRAAAGACRRAWPWPGCSAGEGRRCAGARAPGVRAIRPHSGPHRCCGGAGTARCAGGGAPWPRCAAAARTPPWGRWAAPWAAGCTGQARGGPLGPAGTARPALRRLPGCLTATPWSRELRNGLARGGVFLRPRSAQPGQALAAHLRPRPVPTGPAPLFSAPPPPPS